MDLKFGGSEVWGRAVEIVKSEFSALSVCFRHDIAMHIAEIKSLKTILFRLTNGVDGEKICEACNGKCCDSGIYHFTVTDLMAYLSDGKKLFIPDFSNGRCPYLGLAGCLMEPDYRPFNCITFNCECIETLLAEEDVEKFYEIEKKLRASYASIEKLLGNTFAYGLISNFERSQDKKGGVLNRCERNSEHWGGPNANSLQ